MIHYWAKVINDDKIVTTFTLKENKLNLDEITNNISKICYELDLPTPIVLSKHKNHFANYSSATFLPTDFVEPVKFQKFVIEIF